LVVLQVKEHCLRDPDVTVLRAFVAATQQHDQYCTASHEIDSVTRAVVDAEFTDALADGANIPRIAERKTLYPGGGPRARHGVAQPSQSFPKCLRFPYLEH